MKENFSVVLVHIGPCFYEYLNTCIEQIRRFNNCDIYLILPKKFSHQVKPDVTIIPAERIKKSKKHDLFLKHTTLDKKFRGGFWQFAVERFFFLEEVIQMFQLKNIFHLENDVLLYCDLKKITKIIDDSNFEIAATFDNDNRCIPGFMFFKNHHYLSELTKFISINSGVTDMEIIPKFNDLYDCITYFPVIPDNYENELKSLSGQTTNRRWKYFEHYTKFQSVFDGAAIGQFLGGIDPIHRSGDTSGFINESALFNVSDFTFSWNKDEKGRNIPYLIYKDEKARINNLHIHCKNLTRFQ